MEKDYHVSADLTGQGEPLGCVTIQADIIKQNCREQRWLQSIEHRR